jgi:hypothetical protein
MFGRATAILFGTLTETPSLGYPPSGVPVLEGEIQAGKTKWAVVAKGDAALKLARVPRKVKIRVIGELTQHNWETGNVKRLRPVIIAHSVKAAKQKAMIDA